MRRFRAWLNSWATTLHIRFFERETYRVLTQPIDAGDFEEVPRPEGEPYTIWAEDGEYSEHAGSVAEALMQFTMKHPTLFVSAVTNDNMRPRLVPEDWA